MKSEYCKWCMIHNIIDFHLSSHSLHILWENKKLFGKISLLNASLLKNSLVTAY